MAGQGIAHTSATVHNTADRHFSADGSCSYQLQARWSIFPLLKKGSDDSSQLKNFIPVSNLPILSKLLDRTVQLHLEEYLSASNTMPVHQSAYRRFHSTETALIKTYNGLLMATGDGKVSVVCLLDVMVIFDTIDYELLLLHSSIVLAFMAVVCRGLFLTCRKEHAASLLIQPLRGSPMSSVLCHKVQYVGRCCSYSINWRN